MEGDSVELWGVVPAAGRGTRLGELTSDRPKALVPIGGRPLAAWVLDRVTEVVDGVCVVVPEDDDAIPDRLGRHWNGVPLRYPRQPDPRGVGDAILRCQEIIPGEMLVVMGDVFFADSLGRYADLWRRSRADGAVLVEPVSDSGQEAVGLVGLNGDRVEWIRKRPPAGEAQYGVAGSAILPARTFEARSHLSPSEVTGELELEGLITWLIGEGHDFLALRHRGWRRNVNTPDDVEAVEERLARRGR